MILLTRLSGNKFVVNAELIKFVEETPDTIITLRDNDKIIVKEPADHVIEKVVEYSRMIRMPLN